MATALLVTNDRHDSAGLSAALQRAGHLVVIEHDENGAHSALTGRQIDLLVCEDVLPSVLGTELIAAARSALARPDLPGILLANTPARDSDRTPARRRRGIRMLASPWSGEQLALAIATLQLPETT